VSYCVDGNTESPNFQPLLNLLVNELANSQACVRENAQAAIGLLAQLTQSKSVTDLLMPLRERLLTPIFSKPLRALPFAMQIGNIEAVTYGLTLQPVLLEFNDELVRLLHEALALADADDQTLTSKASQLKHAASLTQLRVACIRLLSESMAAHDFSSTPKLNAIRLRIVQLYFKSLYSNALDVVEVAKKGLQQTIAQQNRLPKELLQTGLRPILLNLSEPKRLSVDGLQGLGRLLELLTNYFKVCFTLFDF
jgi:transformation/transcription domain-associated protein